MPHLIARNVNDLSGGALVRRAATLPRLAVLRLLRVAVLPLYRRSVRATGWLRLNHLNQSVNICIFQNYLFFATKYTYQLKLNMLTIQSTRSVKVRFYYVCPKVTVAHL